MIQRISIILVVVLCCYIGYSFISDSNPLGHFTSIEGKKDFQTAYQEAMKSLPKPTNTKNIKTEYGTVRVYTFTKPENKHKEPILLLPGRLASTPMWEPNLAGLMKQRPVISIDLLGEPGMSVQTKEIRDNRQQAKWLNEVISKLGFKKVHLMGVSFGGWTAMNLVKYYPQQIASVSLLDPVFVFEPIAFKMVIASIPASIPIIPKPIREQMLSYIAGGAETDESEPIAKLIESGMRNFKLKTPAPDQFSPQDLQKIKVPVLAIMAGKSTMHDSTKAVETGKKYVKNIKIYNWANASHAINGEFPSQVNKHVLDFVEHHAQT